MPRVRKRLNAAAPPILITYSKYTVIRAIVNTMAIHMVSGLPSPLLFGAHCADPRVHFVVSKARMKSSALTVKGYLNKQASRL